MAPHSILNDKEDKYRKIKASLVIIGAFIADAALAYKIDKGLHDLKIMAGMPDLEWNFYTSINFYLVLLFGFAAYLVWGFTFEMMINEKIKKSKEIKASILIKGLKKQISELKENIVKLDEKIKLLEGQIQILKQQIDKLKRNLESAMQNPDELSRNLTSFYLGWRQFLNGSSEFDEIKIECENTYNNFLSNAFSTTTK
jgi:cell division protein FtsB